MKIATFAFIAFLSVSVSLSAQDNEKIVKYAYSNITEMGCFMEDPEYISIEMITVNGFSIDKKHHLGIGLGFGTGDIFDLTSSYIPLFFNYRLYFSPEKKRSPHVNIAAGGLVVNGGGGIYSSLTIGFKAGRFSFSSGLSFMAIHRKELDYYYYRYLGTWSAEQAWNYPLGITLKYGFTF